MNYPYHLSVTTPAGSAAVDLTFVKAHCRVDISDDDSLLTAYIAAATSMAETYLRRAFVNTQYKMTLDYLSPGFMNFINGNGGIIFLPRADVVTVDSVKYLDTNGTQQTLSSTEYHYSTGANSRLMPAYNKSWPNHRQFFDSIEITFTAGYGTASDVPAAAKLAIAHIVNHWYTNRSSVEPGAFNEVPQSGLYLLDQLSWGRW